MLLQILVEIIVFSRLRFVVIKLTKKVFQNIFHKNDNNLSFDTICFEHTLLLNLFYVTPTK